MKNFRDVEKHELLNSIKVVRGLLYHELQMNNYFVSNQRDLVEYCQAHDLNYQEAIDRHNYKMKSFESFIDYLNSAIEDIDNKIVTFETE